jgi:hypothetical protein
VKGLVMDFVEHASRDRESPNPPYRDRLCLFTNKMLTLVPLHRTIAASQHHPSIQQCYLVDPTLHSDEHLRL